MSTSSNSNDLLHQGTSRKTSVIYNKAEECPALRSLLTICFWRSWIRHIAHFPNYSSARGTGLLGNLVDTSRQENSMPEKECVLYDRTSVRSGSVRRRLFTFYGWLDRKTSTP